MTISLEKGSCILGSPSLSDYPPVSVDFHFWGEAWAHYALLVGHNVQDVTIEGSGTIDGQGGSFKVVSKKKPQKYYMRPYLIWFAKSQDINLRGINLRSSAFWMQYYLCCDRVRIDDLNIFNHANKNNDMIDIDGCRDVLISNIIGDTDDDGITLKSTCERMNEHITISDCILSSHCNALKLGTESTGGYRNIVISNILVRPSAIKKNISGYAEGVTGLAIEVADGGRLENLLVNNMIIDGTAVPLFIRLCNRGRKHYEGAVQPAIGILQNVQINNLRCSSTSNIGCSISGIPGRSVEHIQLTNCSFCCKGGLAEMPKLPIPEMETEYPEATNFGILPAYGLYIRHAKSIDLDNIHIYLSEKDVRPAIYSENVIGLSTQSIRLTGPMDSQKLIEKK